MNDDNQMEREMTLDDSRSRWTGHRTPVMAIAVACLLAQSVSAQAGADRLTPVGVWRGTSSCTVRPSACHDEVVVYRVTGAGASDSFRIDARKIVNGQEEAMGVISCRLIAPGHLRCVMPGAVWRFTVRADSLVGELRLADSTKYRDVRTARSH